VEIGPFALLLLAVSAHAATDPTAKCQALKLKAAGVKTLAKAKCYQKGLLEGLPVDPECLGKAETKFATSVAKREHVQALPRRVVAVRQQQCLAG
jgi:hypothetical protein